MGWKELHEVQQREVQGSAPGEEQSHAPGHAGATQLASRLPEEDLTDTKLNMIQQCALATTKANGILGSIRQSTASRMSLYSSLVRPHLGCCVQFWAAQYKRDVDTVQNPAKDH